MDTKGWIAIVRVRGQVCVNPDIRHTLHALRLYKKNYCVIVQNSQVFLGMIKKIRDYVTFGELDEGTFAILLKGRGRITSKKPLTAEYLKAKLNTDFTRFAKDFFAFKRDLGDVPGLKHFFKLHPPKGGFERGGIKKAFAVGGALGYRGAAINALIQRMI